MKYALISGISGQIGSFLAELLLSKNYTVYGIVRYSTSQYTPENIKNIKDKITIFNANITDFSSLISIIRKITMRIDNNILEIYNLAGQSSIKVSFNLPYETLMTNAIGTLNFLESIRILNIQSKIRFCQASSSELFGNSDNIIQNEKTPFHPRSPYGVSKLCAHWISVNYRESYNFFICSCIFFNNGSTRMGKNFILRKISNGISQIVNKKIDCLYFGNINAKRDIGSTKDYCEAMNLMLLHDKPNDYVISTGKEYSIREIIEIGFKIIGIKLKWKGKGLEEVGYDDEKIYIKIDPQFFRPCEIESTFGDSSFAKKELGWEAKTTMVELLKELIEYDLNN